MRKLKGGESTQSINSVNLNMSPVYSESHNMMPPPPQPSAISTMSTFSTGTPSIPIPTISSVNTPLMSMANAQSPLNIPSINNNMPTVASLTGMRPISGGKKKATKKVVAKKPIVDAKKPIVDAKKPVPKKKKTGGALINDIKNLAVPFAILLAKQGLDIAFDNNKKTDHHKKKTHSSAASASVKKTRRTATIAGGDCTGNTCNKTKGGSADIKNRFNQLSKEIDNFLKKY